MQNKFQEILEEKISNNESFILFRQPNTSIIELWFDEVETGDYQFVFNSFDDTKKYYFRMNQVLTENLNKLNFDINLRLNPSDKNESILEDEYINLIQNTINFLNDSLNPVKKIVISRIKEVKNTKVDLMKTLLKLNHTYPKAYVYLWFSPEEGVWIGASPELLLEEENLKINTVSLAGTLPKNENWSAKEIHEQQVVTDYIVSKLKGTNNLQVDGPHTVDAGFFNHLKSFISAEVNHYDKVENILNLLHPTPAVCGMPKNDAKHYILDNEGYDRKFYAGYFGFKTPEKSLYFVNLRCAQIFSDVVKLYVGGGIMPNSLPEKEWVETELKSKTIGNLLVTD